MALYVLLNGREAQVMQDLRLICANDPGLTINLGPGPGGTLPSGLVSYTPTLSSVGSVLVDFIANQTLAWVLLRGEVANFGIFPSGAAQVLKDTAGVTVPDSAPASTVEIIYDVTNCNGRGYVVLDANGNFIPYSQHVSLFHELAHAYRFITNTFDPTAIDQGGINDENIFRDALGLPRRSGDPGGCAP
jgi:hypothetical protein